MLHIDHHRIYCSYKNHWVKDTEFFGTDMPIWVQVTTWNGKEITLCASCVDLRYGYSPSITGKVQEFTVKGGTPLTQSERDALS